MAIDMAIDVEGRVAEVVAPSLDGRLNNMKRIPALDGVRGVAIILVVIAHCWNVESGILGVDLFFLLSGYLITSLLINEWQATGTVSLSRFYQRRAWRLLPALALMLGIFAAYEVVVDGSGWRGPRDVALGMSYGANLVDPRLISPGLWHLWSLAIEEQFYLVWPVLTFFLLSRLRLSIITNVTYVAGIAIATVSFYAHPFLGSLQTWDGFNMHLAPLLFGCAVATASSERGTRRITGRQMSVAVGFLIPTFAFFNGGDAFLFVPIFGACTAPLLLALLEDPEGLASRFLSSEPLGVIGRTSYGTYLWHFPLLYLTHHNVPLTLTCTAVAVTLSYRYLEQPLLRRHRAIVRLRPAAT